MFKGLYISTYGCQMNVNDTERMYAILGMQNFVAVKTPEEAEVIIINSCSVREKPFHKVLSELGRYKKLKAVNPLLKVGVAGCVAQQEKEALTEKAPLVDFVFGTDAIDLLPQIIARCDRLRERSLDQRLDKPKRQPKVVETDFSSSPYHIQTLIQNPGVSTFVNIMKGCNNYCSYCVVPYTRGPEKSRPLEQVISDVNSLVSRGVREVFFLGQNVNSYRSECGADFATLLERTCTDTDVWRVRFTTSHPKDFTPELAHVINNHRNKICEYIHLPAQSGSSRILRDMRRGYTRESYVETVNMIKQTVPEVVLSSDFIVGFPGEEEEDFAATLSLIEKVGYETIFGFVYSPRPMTAAAQMTSQVEESIKFKRINQLFDVQRIIAEEMAKKYEGRVLNILVESYDEATQRLSGRSTQNKLVYFDEHERANANALIGQMARVKINKAFPTTFYGERLNG